MNFFRRLFKSNNPTPTPPPSPPKTIIHIQNFRFLYKNKDYTPRISIDYEKLKQHLRKIHQVSEKWDLVFSIFHHGRSLNILREFQSKFTPPFLIVIQDCGDRVFGVLFEDKLDVRKGVFGNRYTFLYRLIKDENTFVKYEAVDNFICHSTNSFVAFGCSDGYYGLLLDSDLNTGESHKVDTFQNDVLGYNQKFLIKEIEMWSICL